MKHKNKKYIGLIMIGICCILIGILILNVKNIKQENIQDNQSNIEYIDPSIPGTDIKTDGTGVDISEINPSGVIESEINRP